MRRSFLALALAAVLAAVALAPRASAALEDGRPPERVEADVSTRSVAVTSSYTGTEIVVFGTVENSRQPSAESGMYDVVIVVEGTSTPVVARRKGRVAGVWLNTASVRFASLPSYYAIASTRPVDEIAETRVLDQHGIGFEHVPMRVTSRGANSGVSDAEAAEFRKAVIRLKQKDGLYVREDFNVVFIGKSLFRASIDLPANVPVGPLVARVYLFREGQLLSSYNARVTMTREGLERFLHTFALEHSFLYGLASVVLAMAAGIAASMIFRKGGAH
jgi:uncharacterized protein (TIGR02186 family)